MAASKAKEKAVEPNVQKQAESHADSQVDASAQKGAEPDEGAGKNEQAGQGENVLTGEADLRAYIESDIVPEARKYGLRIDVVNVADELLAAEDAELAAAAWSEARVRVEAEQLNERAAQYNLVVKVAKAKPAQLDPTKWPAMRYDPATKEGKVFHHPDDVPAHYVENPWT